MKNQISTMNNRYHITLSNYFASKPLYLDGTTQKKPNTRKLVEQPWQQTKAEMWNKITETLCNLDFIQAKAEARMTYELIGDFHAVLLFIPENRNNVKRENEHQARLDEYTKDLVLYARGEINVLVVPESIIPLNEAIKDAEINRIKTNPTRLDKINGYYQFLGKESANLQTFAYELPCLTLQQAWNNYNSGPVGNAATESSKEDLCKLFILPFNDRPLWNPMPLEIKILKGHSDTVNAISITPDGEKAISGSEDNTCILWDLTTGKAIQTLHGHLHGVRTVAITPDGRMAISNSFDSYIVWDLTIGVEIHNIKVRGNVYSVAITPDGKKAISGCEEGVCILWDLESGEAIHTLKGHNGQVCAVAITPDGKKAISGCEDGICILWNLGTGEVLHKMDGGCGSIWHVFITSDGKKAIFSASVWDLMTGTSIHSLRSTASSITPDGRIAISFGTDKTCDLWNLNTGEVFQTFHCPAVEFTAISITSDGKRVIFGSDRTFIIWDLSKGKSLQTQDESVEKVIANFDPLDWRRPISGLDVMNISLQSDLTGQNVIPFRWEFREAITADFIHPDGKSAICGYDGGTCILWDLSAGMELRMMKGHKGRVNAVSISSDGKRAISVSNDKTCILWDLHTGRVVQTLKGHNGSIMAVSITSDGKRAITASCDKTCILWNLNNGEALHILKGHTLDIFTVSLSPDGKTAISGSCDGTCIHWDLSEGKAIQTLLGHTHWVMAVSFTPDGNRVITGSRDKTGILWDLKDGKKIAQVLIDSAIDAVAYLTNGIFLKLFPKGVMFLNADKKLLCPDMVITTLRQIWDFELNQYQDLSADCPLCGHRFSPPVSVLDTIEEITNEAGLNSEQSPCLELPDKYWEDPGLLSNCPKCGEGLKFNPFMVLDPELDKNKKYEEEEKKFAKIFEIAETAFRDGNYDNSIKLYLKLIQAEKFDANYMRFNIAICRINSLTENNPEIISNINVLMRLLQEKGENERVQIIAEKLKARLDEIKTEKTWWKKIF